mgnify:CR=1 FL=1
MVTLPVHMLPDTPTAVSSPDGWAAMLEVTRALAAPFDLHSLLERITWVARQLVRVERVSVWLHDAACGELYVEVAGDLPAVLCAWWPSYGSR